MKDVILEYDLIYISGFILHSILLIFTRGGKVLFNILDQIHRCRVMVIVFNATFNNISVISVLLMEETGVTGKNTDLPQVTDKLYQIIMRVV